MTIQLNRADWHSRFFFWALSISEECFGVHSMAASGRTNLCQYMRTLFLNMPLAIALNLAWVAGIVWVFVGFPGQTLGWWLYVMIVSGIAIAVLGLIGICAAWSWGRGIIDSRQKPEKSERESITQHRFWTLLWEYVVSQKQKICPIIEIN